MTDDAKVQHLLPYGHLLYARLEELEIILEFAMHEVCIRGDSLADIFQKIQNLCRCDLDVGDANGVTEILVRHRDEAWPEPETAEPGETED
ncbi:MAG: hypothetical protein ACOYM3_13460 [Terrimicrobiaceae bacterium]